MKVTSSALARSVVALCSLHVLTGCGASGERPAESPPLTKGVAREVTRDVLVRGNLEKGGYGAYSYILLTHPPAADARGTAVLLAYSALNKDEPPDPTLSPELQRDELNSRNLTYVPVDQRCDGDPPAAWLTAHYDIGRSVRLLHTQQLEGAGPYIVTYTAPLSLQSERVDLAVLDLSSVPEQSMAAWVAYFESASRQPDALRRQSAVRVLLKLNDVLTRAEHGITLTIEGMAPVGSIARAFALPIGAQK